jgi:hypothetical protein
MRAWALPRAEFPPASFRAGSCGQSLEEPEFRSDRTSWRWPVITTTGRSAAAALDSSYTGLVLTDAVRDSSYAALALSDAPLTASMMTLGRASAADGLAAEVGSRCAHPASAAPRVSTQAAAIPNISFERFMCVTSNTDVRPLEARRRAKFSGGEKLHRTFTCAYLVTSEAASIEAASAPSPRLRPAPMGQRLRCERPLGPPMGRPSWASAAPGVQRRRVLVLSDSTGTCTGPSWLGIDRSSTAGLIPSRLACHWRAHKLDPHASTIVAAVRNHRAGAAGPA